MPPKRGVTADAASRALSKPVVADASFTLDDVLSVQPRSQEGPNRSDTGYVAQLELCTRSLAAFPAQACVCPEVPLTQAGPARSARFYAFFHDASWSPGDAPLVGAGGAPSAARRAAAGAHAAGKHDRLAWARTLDAQAIMLLQVACVPASLADLAPPALAPIDVAPLFGADGEPTEPPTGALAPAPTGAANGAVSAAGGRPRKHAHNKARVVFATRTRLDDDAQMPKFCETYRGRFAKHKDVLLRAGAGPSRKGTPRLLDGSRAHDHLVRLNRKAIASHQGHKIATMGASAGGAGAAAKYALDKPIWSAKQMSKWEGKWPMLPDMKLHNATLSADDDPAYGGRVDRAPERAVFAPTGAGAAAGAAAGVAAGAAAGVGAGAAAGTVSLADRVGGGGGGGGSSIAPSGEPSSRRADAFAADRRAPELSCGARWVHPAMQGACGGGGGGGGGCVGGALGGTPFVAAHGGGGPSGAAAPWLAPRADNGPPGGGMGGGSIGGSIGGRMGGGGMGGGIGGGMQSGSFSIRPHPQQLPHEQRPNVGSTGVYAPHDGVAPGWQRAGAPGSCLCGGGSCSAGGGGGGGGGSELAAAAAAGSSRAAMKGSASVVHGLAPSAQTAAHTGGCCAYAHSNAHRASSAAAASSAPVRGGSNGGAGLGVPPRAVPRGAEPCGAQHDGGTPSNGSARNGVVLGARGPAPTDSTHNSPSVHPSFAPHGAQPQPIRAGEYACTNAAAPPGGLPLAARGLPLAAGAQLHAQGVPVCTPGALPAHMPGTLGATLANFAASVKAARGLKRDASCLGMAHAEGRLPPRTFAAAQADVRAQQQP
ncbi:hypothetical protein KFE25_013795 [Diacronema lutheri]|uniref:Uncharacterized protein n=1 Tax=Diacronema lutheri TaxID=2081491 RepID=A0A8J6CBG7_DIALT|nr:hypothetical protein KFE25_013795 [Diacronema lutheri]